MKIFIKENWFLFKMKKIIFLIIFSFFFLHFVDASQVYLDSILSQEDLISLNQQISFLEENYGIKLKFIVEDTDPLAIRQSFLYFHILHLDEGEMKNWNLLVFYNIQRNELRFVTYKECSIGNKDLENIKNRNFVLNVLNSDNPSNEDVSKMFLGISNEVFSLINSYQPSPNSCRISYYEDNLELRDSEYVVPQEVLKALYVLTMDKDWDSPLTNPHGLYVHKNLIESKSLDFLPFFTSKKEKYYHFLQDHTQFSHNEIDTYYKLITTKGNILLLSDYTSSILIHERVHKILSEELSSYEFDILYSSREEFLNYLTSQDTDSGVGDITFFNDYISAFLSLSIIRGSWQEFYAYMITFEKYPQSQNENQYIDKYIYDLFSSRHPEAYQIYRKVFDLVSN